MTLHKHGVKPWREIYPVHPCADVFPLMDAEELTALAADIKANGLRAPIVLWHDPSTQAGTCFVLDGRNRLDALERNGDAITPDAPFFSKPSIQNPAAFVISANIRRRHLTNTQRAELIWAVLEAGKNDKDTMSRSFNPTPGKAGGSTKDPILAAAVAEGAKVGIHPKAIQRARPTLGISLGLKKKTQREPAPTPDSPPFKRLDRRWNPDRVRAVRAALAKIPSEDRETLAALFDLASGSAWGSPTQAVGYLKKAARMSTARRGEIVTLGRSSDDFERRTAVAMLTEQPLPEDPGLMALREAVDYLNSAAEGCRSPVFKARVVALSTEATKLCGAFRAHEQQERPNGATR